MSIFFKTIDGNLSNNVYLTSSKSHRFFEGVLPETAVSVQVSVRGSAFTTDNSLISFSSGTFVIPNPSKNNKGIEILDGENEILVRFINGKGTVSDPAKYVVKKIEENDLGLLIQKPTGISIEQKDQTVKIQVEGSSNILGCNFYATTTSGRNYIQINPQTITQFSEEDLLEVFEESKQDFVNPPSDFPITINGVTQVFDIPLITNTVQAQITLSNLKKKRFFSFEHDREGVFPNTVPVGEFSALQDNENLFYVAAFVFYDPVQGLEIESDFSLEVSGRPTKVSDTVASFPIVTRGQFEQDIILSLFRNRPQLDIKAGSYTRDAVIDPAATQFSRLAFILDFSHRAQSFSTLLEIDDPNLTTESIPVIQSAYKTTLKDAFFLSNDDDVQSLIDFSFDFLASRVGVTRKEGSRARGTVTFYTRTKPPQSILIPLGTLVSGGSINFRTTQQVEININNIASFYDPLTGRYAVKAFVEAEELGSQGILAAGQLSELVNSISGVFIVNESSTFGGLDRESNYELAIRAQRKYNAIRTSSKYYYEQEAFEIGGVEEVFSITANDPLMRRGQGSLDLWIRGQNLSSVSENFALPFEVSENAIFIPVDTLTFRSLDPQISPENPIIQVLSIPSKNWNFVNTRTGFVHDLTNVQVVDFRTIRLDDTLNSASSYLSADTFLGTYRFLKSKNITLKQQPVFSVETLEGQLSGLLDVTLSKTDDPLIFGYSTKAKDSIFVEVDSSLPPSIQIENEEHTLIAEYVDYLGNLGVNPYSIRVYNQNKTFEYVGSLVSSTPDFFIEFGDEKNPYGIYRNPAGNIQSGQQLLVDYEHDEVFNVSYTVNAITQVVQNRMEEIKNVSEDILVKEASPISVDISATVVLERGASPSLTDNAIRTNLINAINNLKQRRAIRQSDVIEIIDSTEGVSYLKVPLTKLSPSVDSTIINHPLNFSSAQLILPWSNEQNSVYLLTEPLPYQVAEAGGSMVFVTKEDNSYLVVLKAFSEFHLKSTPNSCFVISHRGLTVPDVAETKNRILVSLPNGIKSVSEKKKLSANALSYLSESLILEQTVAVENYIKDVDYKIFLLSSGQVALRRIQGGAIVENQEVTIQYKKENLRNNLEKIFVTYQIGLSDGIYDIQPSPFQFLEVGEVELNFDEDI